MEASNDEDESGVGPCRGSGCLLGLSGDASADEGDLAVRARDILHKHCYGCHGLRLKVEGYDVLDWTSLTAPRPNGKRPYVVPGKPGDSDLWRHLDVVKDMPPEDEPRLADVDLSVIREWIASGTKLPRFEPVHRRAC